MFSQSSRFNTDTYFTLYSTFKMLPLKFDQTEGLKEKDFMVENGRDVVLV